MAGKKGRRRPPERAGTASKAVLWRAVVHYRTDAGLLDVEHFLDELGDLHELVEAGPHWDTIERIEILRHCAAGSGLTVEAAEEL